VLKHIRNFGKPDLGDFIDGCMPGFTRSTFRFSEIVPRFEQESLWSCVFAGSALLWMELLWLADVCGSTKFASKGSERRNRVDDFLCAHHGAGVVRDIDVERGMHHLI